jgi:hypothetical protein
MLYKSFKMFVMLTALATMLAWSRSASAEIVASWAGPKDFNGTSSDVEPLSGISIGKSIGQEGRVDLEFNIASDLSASTPMALWYCADVPGGNAAEYTIQYDRAMNQIGAYLWGSGTYFAQTSIGFDPDGNWHTVSFAWKQNQQAVLTLDGVTQSAITHLLPTFASGSGCHVLGENAYNGGVYFYEGGLRNVVVYNTYTPTPEPSTIVLLATGIIGLLAYAWRKRR